MGAVQRFKDALKALLEPAMAANILAGWETITDDASKNERAAFFIQAIQRMDEQMDFETRCAVRDACACSKGGWRLKAVQKIAHDFSSKNLAEKIAALGQVTHMGMPVLNNDGTITASIGEQGGFACPCPVFSGLELSEPVSSTYCLCCAGHFRFHYQIALGVKLKTRAVVSSALASNRQNPCRFVYQVVE